MQRKLTVLTAALALVLSGSLAAFAYPSADTALVYGYDEDEATLVYGTSETLTEEDVENGETSLDCTVEDGSYVYTLSEESETIETDDGDRTVETSDVESLNENDGDDDEPVEGDEVEFSFEEDNDETNDEDSFAYSSDDAEECQLTGIDVTGPEGQVNHGTIVSAFVHALQASGWEGGIGCLVRYIAASDFGMDDQQLEAGDELAEGTDPLAVDLGSVETMCRPQDQVAANENGDVTGQPAWVTAMLAERENGKPTDVGPAGDGGGAPFDVPKPDNGGGEDD